MSDPTFKKAVENAFDEASAGYDRPALQFFDRGAEALVRQISLRGDEHVLDAATGTGKIALALAARLHDGHVTGIDLSSGMLAAARKKAEARNLQNLSFRQADVDAVTFPPASFDGLTCGFGVHFWTNMEASLARLAGFVKPGGFVGITSFAKGSFEPQSILCLKRFESYGVKMPDTYTWERLDHPDKNRQLFEAVGLTDVRCEKQQVGAYLKNTEDWWDLVVFTGFRAFLNQLNESQAARYKAEHLKEIEATRGEKGIFLNVEVITAVGRK